MKKMMELLELQEAIEYQRNRVGTMIEAGIDDEDFMRENRRLDQLIDEYIELEKQEKQEKRLLVFGELKN